MDLSEIIKQKAQQALIHETATRVSELLLSNGIKLGMGDLTQDDERGTVTVDSKYTFTTVGRSLRMLVPCPKCGMDVPSIAINSMVDIAIMTTNPKPAPHDCMDV